MIAFLGVLTVAVLLLLVLMPSLGRRRMSANLSRYLRLHWVEQTRSIPPPTVECEDLDDGSCSRRIWTALDDQQLTRLLRDSSPEGHES